MFWNNLVLESYCFGGKESAPCGQEMPSGFCLANGLCPYYAYAVVTERDAAKFVPLRLILKDRIGAWTEGWWWRSRYHLWDRWQYTHNMIETDEDDDVVLKVISDEKRTDRNMWRKYLRWLKKANEEAECQK